MNSCFKLDKKKRNFERKLSTRLFRHQMKTLTLKHKATTNCDFLFFSYILQYSTLSTVRRFYEFCFHNLIPRGSDAICKNKLRVTNKNINAAEVFRSSWIFSFSFYLQNLISKVDFFLKNGRV